MAGQRLRRLRDYLRRVAVSEMRGERPCLRQPGADGGEVARPAALQRQPIQSALYVGNAGKRSADPIAERAIAEHLHPVQPPGDFARIGRGGGKPRGQQPRARAGDGAIDGGQKRSLAPARQRARQFQIAPRGGVDPHPALQFFSDGRAKQRQGALLGDLDVVRDGAEGGDLRPPESSEPVERLHAIQGLQPRLSGGAVETRRRKRRRRRAGISDQVAQRRVVGGGLRQKHLTRRDPRQHRPKRHARGRGDAHLTG